MSRGDRYANGAGAAPLPAAEVWLHHSVTAAANGAGIIRTVEQIGQSRFAAGISYTWPITPDGTIYEGHSVDRQGTHTGGRNDHGRAICFVGNYENDRPTDAQIRSAAWLLQHAHRSGWIRAPRLDGGHRDVKQTACPGKHAYAAIHAINQLAAGGPIEEATVFWTEKFTAPNGRTFAAWEYLVYANLYAGQAAAAIVGLTAAVDRLAEAVAADSDELTADELKSAVREAIEAGLVKVQIVATPEGSTT